MKKIKGIKIGICLLIFSMLLSNNFVFADDKKILDENIVNEEEVPNIEEAPVIEEVPDIKEDILQEPPVDEVKQEEKTEEVKEEIVEEEKKEEPRMAPKASTIWDGSKDTSWFTNDKEVYEISTPSQLAGLAELVNNGNEMKNITFKLINDIYLNDTNSPTTNLWTMIGKDGTNPFAGSIDGQNHTVHNVYVNVTDAATTYTGFLGITSNAAPLKNIKVSGKINGSKLAAVIGYIADDVTLEGITNKAAITAEEPSGIVPEANGLLIKNCINEGTIKSTVASASNTVNTAGIIGMSSTKKLTMINCHNKGTITGNGFVGGLISYGDGTMDISSSSNSAVITGKVATGGLVGQSNYITTMTDCHNTGKIAGYGLSGGLIGYGGSMYISESSNTGDIIGDYLQIAYDIGGLVGKAIGGKTTVQISNSTNSGNIKGLGSVGGIIGTNSGGLITDCKNLGGTVESYYGNAGGIVGFQTVNASFAEINWGSVIRCSNKANVSTGNHAQYSNQAGGIIGSTDRMNSIQDCVNEGSVTAPIKIAGGIIGKGNVSITGCKNSGNVTVNGGGQAAGIRGSGQGSIDGCENSGDVTASEDFVGGIQGDHSGPMITNSKNTGNIKGRWYIGGVVGAYDNNLTNCINEGNVTGDWYAGGIVGVGQANITNCQNLGGVVDGKNQSGGIIGRSNSGKEVTIENCINKAKVKGTDANAGIVGYVASNITILDCSNEGTIESSYNTGGIIGKSESTKATIKKSVNKGIINGVYSAAGIAAYTKSELTILECENQGAIKGNSKIGGIIGEYESTKGTIEKSVNIGTVNGEDRVAGIVGSANSEITILSCTNENTITGVYSTAGILGRSESPKGTITNSINKGIIAGNQFTGGIVAYLKGDNGVSDCTNQGEIKVNSNSTVVASRFGGIAGYVNNQVKINECINEGVIRPNGNWTGGIVGSNSGQIKNCINKGNMYFGALSDSNNTDAISIGQITGWSDGTITSCTNEGDLEVLIKADYYTLNNGTKGVDYDIGGISGLIENTTITDCVNKGKIYITRNNKKKTNYHNHNIGGISGYALNSTVDKSHNLGNIHLEETNGLVDHTDQFYIGGIVSTAARSSVINECINSGELRTNVFSRVGGITCSANPATITNCISAGDLYNDSNEVGFHAGISYAFNSSSKMDNVYFIGEMHILNDNLNYLYGLGGIAGNISYPENIRNAYYNIDNIPYTLDNPIESATVRGLHTSEMIGKKAKEVMTEFDFENMWIIHEDQIEANNNMRYYPSLRSNPDMKFGAKFHLVSFEKDSGYEIEVKDTYDKTGFVMPNQDYQFTLNIKDTHKDMDYVVKDNGVEIHPITKNGTYKLSNIQEDHQITVVFKKITPSVTFPTEVTIQYGESLKNATYEFAGKGTMRFKEADRKLSVSESGQKHIMVFTPKDTLQYEIVEKEVTVHVTPIRTNKPKDIQVEYSEGLKLKDVALPKGWSWQEPTTIVKVGTHVYKASFYDAQGNYLNEVNTEILITMDKEVIVPPVVGPSDPDKPNEPSIPNQPDQPGVPDKPEIPGEPNNPDQPREPDNKVDTGDTSTIVWYSSCTILALGIMLAVKLYRKNKNL